MYLYGTTYDQSMINLVGKPGKFSTFKIKVIETLRNFFVLIEKFVRLKFEETFKIPEPIT